MKKIFTLLPILLISINIYAQDDIVWDLSFKNTSTGSLSEAELEAEGGTMDWMSLNNNSYVVDDIEHNNSLKIKYPAGHVGPDGSSGGPSGSQFIKYLPSSNEYVLDYYVKFDDNFEFVKGGKLPGLTSGGGSWTGGNRPTNGQGFSARYMWVQNGKMLLYFYYWDMKDAFEWEFPLGVNFEKGKWHRLTQRIKLNTTNIKDQADGILQVFVDGEQVIYRDNIRYMNVNGSGIDTFYFSTFYGGSSSSWAPQNSTYAYLDKFVVSTDMPNFTTNHGISTNTWKNFLVNDYSEVFNVEFDMKANQNNMDGVTGILKGSASDYSDLSCIVRLKPDGTLDAYNNDTYMAENNITYNTSNLFHVKMQIDTGSGTYDVYISKDGGEDIVLATQYKFRNKTFSKLDSWSLYAYNGSHSISNMVFKKGALSNESYVFNSIKVYPTVIKNNELTFQVNSSIVNNSFIISLLTIDGRLLEEKSVRVNKDVTNLVFSSLLQQHRGVYLLQIENDGMSKIIKLLKK